MEVALFAFWEKLQHVQAELEVHVYPHICTVPLTLSDLRIETGLSSMYLPASLPSRADFKRGPSIPKLLFSELSVSKKPLNS